MVEASARSRPTRAGCRLLDDVVVPTPARSRRGSSGHPCLVVPPDASARGRSGVPAELARRSRRPARLRRPAQQVGHDVHHERSIGDHAFSSQERASDAICRHDPLLDHQRQQQRSQLGRLRAPGRRGQRRPRKVRGGLAAPPAASRRHAPPARDWRTSTDVVRRNDPRAARDRHAVGGRCRTGPEAGSDSDEAPVETARGPPANRAAHTVVVERERPRAHHDERCPARHAGRHRRGPRLLGPHLRSGRCRRRHSWLRRDRPRLGTGGLLAPAARRAALSDAVRRCGWSGHPSDGRDVDVARHAPAARGADRLSAVLAVRRIVATHPRAGDHGMSYEPARMGSDP